MGTCKEWSWVPLWLAMSIVAIWARPAIPVDETRYLSVAWEMWTTGHFLVPCSNGAPYPHKPPLLFWLIHLSWWLFDLQEWPARLTSPLCGLLAIFLSRKMASTLYPESPDIRQRVPFIFLACTAWSLFASLTMFDTLLSCFALLAHLILLYAATGKTRYWWVWLGMSVGCGLLTKGPVIYIYVLPVVALAPWWMRTLPVSTKQWLGESLLAVLISLVMALLWALSAAYQGGHDYAYAILIGQTTGRIVNSFAHPQPFYWYLLVLPLMFFPWSCYLPIWKNLCSLTLSSSERFLLSIFVPGLVILSLISGKQPHYLLSLMPAGIILLSRGTVNLPKMTEIDLHFFFVVIAGIGITISILPLLPFIDRSFVLVSFLPGWLFIIPLISSLPFFLTKQGEERVTVSRIASSSILLFLLIHIVTARSIHTDFDAPAIFARMSAESRCHHPIYVFPAKLKDQFHFSARLSGPVEPFSSLRRVTMSTETGTKGVAVYYLRQRVLPLLPKDAIAEVYKNGWLVLLPIEKSFYLATGLENNGM